MNIEIHMKRTAVTVATPTFWVSLLCTGLRWKDCIAKQLFGVTTVTLGNVICTCIRCLTSCPQRCINLAMTAMTKEKERQRLGKANFPRTATFFGNCKDYDLLVLQGSTCQCVKPNSTQTMGTCAATQMLADPHLPSTDWLLELSVQDDCG